MILLQNEYETDFMSSQLRVGNKLNNIFVWPSIKLFQRLRGDGGGARELGH